MSDADAKETAELQARLEAARAAREKRDAENASKARLDRLRADTEAEERALAEERQIDELTEKYGPVGKAWDFVRTDAGMIAVKKPNHLLFKRFQDKESTKTDDLDVLLVRPCLIYPSKAEYDRIIEEVPAALTKAGNAIAALAGFRREDLAKK